MWHLDCTVEFVALLHLYQWQFISRIAISLKSIEKIRKKSLEEGPCKVCFAQYWW